MFIYLGEGENGTLQLATSSVYRVHTDLKAATPDSGEGMQLPSGLLLLVLIEQCWFLLPCLLPYTF